MEYNGLISRLGIAGFEQIEPAIMVCWALGWPIRLIGRPGTAKTRLADKLSVAENGTEFFRRFDCPKENIVTIAGMPNIEKMKEGIFSFVHKTENGTGGFIWDKKNLVFNELTRISAEGMNYLLEPLQEGTFFGQPLPIQRNFGNPEDIHTSIIATENPEGTGVKRVDPALFDRFYMAVNVPDGQNVIGRDQRRGIVGGNIYRRSSADGIDDILTAFAIQFRREFGNVIRDASLVHSVIEYGITLWETFFDSNKTEAVYISNRRQSLVTEIILAFTAYQRLITNKLDLIEAADMALNYGVIVPMILTKSQGDNLKAAHSKAKMYLSKTEMTPKEKFEAELQTRPALTDKIKYIKENKDQFVSLLKIDERENILGGRILQVAAPYDLIAVYDLLKTLSSHDELFRKCEVQIISAVSDAVFTLRDEVSRIRAYSFDDTQVFDNLQTFFDYLGQGKLPNAVIRYLLKPISDTPENRLSSIITMCEKADQLQVKTVSLN